jgi:hypothetical protein
MTPEFPVDRFVRLSFRAMVHTDVVIGLACALCVSFNASIIILATFLFAIFRLCCRCRVANEAKASQHQQSGKGSHDDSPLCASPLSRMGGAQTAGKLQNVANRQSSLTVLKTAIQVKPDEAGRPI